MLTTTARRLRKTQSGQVLTLERQPDHFAEVCHDLVEVATLGHRMKLGTLGNEALLVAGPNRRMDSPLHLE
jgi:hypothetical protein